MGAPVDVDGKSREELLSENEELTRRLEEAEQVLHAIQGGEVDALVVSLPKGEQIFTLQGAEHPYRVLVETMNEGAVTLAPDGSIVYCNSYLSAMLEVPQERLTGTALESFVAPADRPLFSELLEHRAKDGAKEEISLVSSSGRRVPVLFSCSAVQFAGSRGMSAVFTDITARKQAERTILRLNRLYSVLSAINHAIVHADDRGEIFRVCCSVAVESGGFRLAWIGMADRESGFAEVAAANGDTAYLEELRQSGEAWSGAVGPTGTAMREGAYVICNDLFEDGLTLPWQQLAQAHGFRASASIAIRHNLEVVGTLNLYADEKDFFDAQQVELLEQIGSDISFALDRIQQAVSHREAELALQDEVVKRLVAVEELRRNEQLLIQQSRLAALGEMIGNIAHQWRQPLNNLGLLVQQVPLLSRAGQVDQEFLDKNAVKSMEHIQHMSKTIDDFRNFFKPDKEKVEFKVHDEVAKTLSLMEGSFRKQQIRIEVRAAAEPEILGYPNEFSQVLLNILINARDALAERDVAEPKITITLAMDKGRAVVTIADNAGGIPEEIIDKIFDPYFTTKGPQAGTGVGLFMSKNIIEKNMGGRLSVRNVEGGAAFTIEV